MVLGLRVGVRRMLVEAASYAMVSAVLSHMRPSLIFSDLFCITARVSPGDLGDCGFRLSDDSRVHPLVVLILVGLLGAECASWPNDVDSGFRVV